MHVDLSPGKVRVNEIWHATNGKNFHAFEIDLASKYPGEVSWDYGDNDIRVWLEASERTLNTDDALDTTFVTIPLSSDEGWRCMSEAVRYTWRIVLWRPDRNVN